MQLSQYQADQSILATYRSAKVNPAVVTLVELGPYLTNLANPLRLSRNLLTLLKVDAEGYAPLDLMPGEGIESYLSLATDFAGPATTPALAKRNHLLRLIALDDQYSDREIDARAGKPNFFDGMDDATAQKTWQDLRDTWLAAARAIHAPELDAYVSLEAAASVRGYWGA